MHKKYSTQLPISSTITRAYGNLRHPLKHHSLVYMCTTFSGRKILWFIKFWIWMNEWMNEYLYCHCTSTTKLNAIIWVHSVTRKINKWINNLINSTGSVTQHYTQKTSHIQQSCTINRYGLACKLFILQRWTHMMFSLHFLQFYSIQNRNSFGIKTIP